MKTIKTKILLTPDQELKVRAMMKDLEWVWNETLKQALRLHTITWFDWAHKHGHRAMETDTTPDLNCVLVTPIYTNQKSAWVGATCLIAHGGSYWKRSDRVKSSDVVIQSDQEWYDHTNIDLIKTKEGKFLHPYVLVQGDKPYTPIAPQAYEPTSIIGGKNDGDVIAKLAMMQNSGRLNALRKAQDLPDLQAPSAYVNGVIDKFMVSWDAFLKPKNKFAKKPRWKNEDAPLNYIYSRHNGRFPKVSGNVITNAFDSKFGRIECVERDLWKRLPHDADFRSWTLIEEPSGWYMCMSYNSDHLDNVSINPGKGLVCGVDPGVKVRVATDHGALFQGNYRRSRVQRQIEVLQHRLSAMKNTNDITLGVKRQPTINEQKLKAKIARLHEKGRNSSNAFDHKLSTRLSRTYSTISWEDTQLQNLAKQVMSKLAEDGSYAPNGRAAKAGLNQCMKLSTLGSLRSKTETKMVAMGRTFVNSPAPNTSRKCSCCGEKGYRPTQADFICQNNLCKMFNVVVNADTNAAKNHKKSFTG